MEHFFEFLLVSPSSGDFVVKNKLPLEGTTSNNSKSGMLIPAEYP